MTHCIMAHEKTCVDSKRSIYTDQQLVGRRCSRLYGRTKGDFRGTLRCRPFPLRRFRPRQDSLIRHTALPLSDRTEDNGTLSEHQQ